MSNRARSCLQCRVAKVKCDYVRPVCGRCTKRGTVCDGYHIEGEFGFRDETVRAQQLSRRARKETENEVLIFDLDPTTTKASTEAATGPSIEANELQAQFPWLNEQALATIPARIKQDTESRAVQLFFANWIVYPNEVSPGYLHHLPFLYEKSAPESVLHQALRAVAFADIRGAGREYTLKGFKSYSAAIARLRTIVQDPANVEDDQILAALLLIDTFETVYIGQNEPLGLHDKALKHLLDIRGTEPLHSAQSFCLSRVAICRLQARQLLLGEDGSAVQQALIDSLNRDRPDLRVIHHVSQIIHFCSIADRLVDQSASESDADIMAHVTNLLHEVRELISSIETWTSTLDERVKPIALMSDLTPALGWMTTACEYHPMGSFQCPNILKHHDITLAFLWSFFAAAQIILRERICQVLRFAASLSEEDAQYYIDRIPGEELGIDGLSSSIIRSVPKFMGFDVGTSTFIHPQDKPSQASSLGRFLGVFALLVVKKTEATSKTHKDCADMVLSWMHKRYHLQ